MSDSTPRSCEMKIMETSPRCLMRRNSCMMAYWLMESMAVVGSSAMISEGCMQMASPIMTRCNMPPESWCGYLRSTSAGSWMRIRRRMSSILFCRGLPFRAVCSCRVSAICSPMRYRGSKQDMGFCRTMLILPPRRRRSCSGVWLSRGLPSKRELPVTWKLSSSRPSRALQVMLLPLPDSPRMPRHSPLATEKETRSTSCTRRFPCRKWTDRSLTVRISFIGAPPWDRGRRAGSRPTC